MSDEKSKKIAVEVVNPTISTCLQEIAFNNGYKWQHSEVTNTRHITMEYLFFDLSYKTIACAHSKCRIETPLNAIDDFTEIVKRLEEKIPESLKKVNIGDYQGEISEDGQTLVIDCQKISIEEVWNVFSAMSEQKVKFDKKEN